MEALQGWIEKEGFITLVMSQQSIKIQLPKPILLNEELPYFSL